MSWQPIICSPFANRLAREFGFHENAAAAEMIDEALRRHALMCGCGKVLPVPADGDSGETKTCAGSPPQLAAHTVSGWGFSGYIRAHPPNPKHTGSTITDLEQTVSKVETMAEYGVGHE